MLSLERVSRNGLNPYLRPFSALFSVLLPSAAIVATDKNAKYPAIQAYWDADPLTCHTNTRVRNANEYLNITEATMARLEEATFPFIVFHSENDTMCDVDGSKALYLRAGSADKTLRLVNQMWHILVKEEGNEKVRDTMIEWMLERI
jgi:acylglycerol lipase